eukprot:gene6358-10364_t
MKFSSIVCFTLLSLLFIQISALRYAGDDWNSYGGGGGYDYGKQKSYADDNLYNVATGANKKQSDSISNYQNLYTDKNAQEQESNTNKKSSNLYEDDNFSESSKFKDDLLNKRNTKANERDDLDQNSNALKFAKNNRNAKDSVNKVSYNNAQDDLDQTSLDKLNQNNLRKNKNAKSQSSSSASHAEATDNVMNNVGLGYSGGYGHESKGGAPSHQSRMQHQQQHDFYNDDSNASDSELEQADLNKVAQATLKKRQSLINFDKDDRLNLYNEDNVDFANKNDNLKQRRNKDYVDSTVESRNIYKDNDVDKSSTKKSNQDLFDQYERSQNLRDINSQNSNYAQNHGYAEGDTRAKKITRDQGSGYGWDYGY